MLGPGAGKTAGFQRTPIRAASFAYDATFVIEGQAMPFDN
jgi:hypothetical protein